MKNNKLLGIVLWAVFFVAAHLILFLIPNVYSVAIWVCYAFTLWAFGSQLILWLALWKGKPNASQRFLNLPALFISIVYLLAQLITDIVFACFTAATKASIFVNALVCIVMTVLLLAALIAKNAISHLDEKNITK